eukprot:PITA_24684
MIQHKRNNRILALKNREGHLIHSQEEMEVELTHYFSSLLKEQRNDHDQDIKKITKHIPKILTKEHNKILLRKVSLQEVEDVVTGIPNSKAPESRIQKSALKALNSTFLTLIPKGNSADSPDTFQPITHCTVIYKIISKVLANRLKSVLPLLISHHQSRYVEGKKIMDNIILSHELRHFRKVKNKPDMMIQVDMSKAINKISWEYMRQVLAAFGFLKESIKWITVMVSGVLFSMLLNGYP